MGLDTFYSAEPTHVWQRVLGPGLHYHFGVEDPIHDPFDAAVIRLLQYIPAGSRVLDCGCGWGGPARILQKHGCFVQGVTISREQHRFITDFPVWLADLHDLQLEEEFDVAMFMESMGHLDDPGKVLKAISPFVRSVIIKDYAAPEYFPCPEWMGHFRTERQFREMLTDAGYQVRVYEEFANYFQPSVDIWLSRLNALEDSEVTGQILLLKQLCLAGKQLEQSNQADPTRLCLVHAVR
ncbi:MAG: class I SAM-dependent methyltransferase [Planctomycetota bacterium]